MDLYFGGAEIPGHRKMLSEAGVSHVALSYVGLRRRVKFARPWLIGDKFDGQQVFLDSGAYTINRAEDDKYTVGELHAMADHYAEFVRENINDIAMFSEFDVSPLGPAWIDNMRRRVWSEFDPEKFLPIWHPEFGLQELESLVQSYPRVGIPQVALNGRNLTPMLNGYVAKYGTRLHGVAMTKPEEMAAVRWDSVASTSWISPSQYGDTIVWTGKELKRYPKKYKDQARKRHRTLFESAGFDAQKIETDDTGELLRFTIWSWQQLAVSIERHHGEEVVAMSADQDDNVNEESGGEGVVMPYDETRKSVTTARPRSREEKQRLPVLGELVSDDASEGVGGPLLRVRGESMRICDTCFLARKCPAYDPGATCAYDIPVEVKTKDQIKALSESLIEWQFQRVAFMKMTEDMEGGYADPNLSREIDRLMALMAKKHELEQEGFSLKIEAKERGQAGTISRLFGRDAGQQLRELENPVQVPDAMRELGIVDAEVVDLP